MEIVAKLLHFGVRVARCAFFYSFLNVEFAKSDVCRFFLLLFRYAVIFLSHILFSDCMSAFYCLLSNFPIRIIIEV